MAERHAAALARVAEVAERLAMKHADRALVTRMDRRMVGESPAYTWNSCGPPPAKRAPWWLRHWTVYELPKLPPSPDTVVVEP